MSTLRSSRRLRRYSVRQTRAGVRLPPDSSSGRGAPRRHLELAGDVAPLLRQPAETVGIALDLVDMQIGFLVQRPEQFAHAREHRGEIGSLLLLGIGALADMDVYPVTRELLLGERPAAGEPVGRVNRLRDDGRDLRILVQDFC